MKIINILLFIFVFVWQLNAQTDANFKKDEQIILGFFIQNDSATNLSRLSPSQRVIKAALYLLNIPYVGATLEGNAEEQLVVNLRELDCTTLVENSLALSRTAQQSFPDFELFCRELKYIRYRGGMIDGYASRLHYTTDWITDNIRKNVVEDVTNALGGKRLPIHVSYMSTHPESYPALKNNPEEIVAVKNVEMSINARNSYNYIPKQEIREKQSLIKDGDIVCFTISTPGLDVSHVGIAYWQKGELTFIHASSKAKKVIVNTESLADYCIINKSITGIMVLRPV